MGQQKHVEDVFDMYNNNLIKYPVKYVCKYKYDFIFTKNNTWYYISSSNDKEKLKKTLGPAAESKKQRWRIIEATTGVIADENK